MAAACVFFFFFLTHTPYLAGPFTQDPQYHDASVRAVCYPHAVCHSPPACPSLRFLFFACPRSGGCTFPSFAHSACLFAHLLANQTRPRPLCLPVTAHTITVCTRCAYGSMFRLSLCSPRGSCVLIDDWEIYEDQSPALAVGSDHPTTPSPPNTLFSRHMTLAFKRHDCCHPALVPLLVCAEK